LASVPVQKLSIAANDEAPAANRMTDRARRQAIWRSAAKIRGRRMTVFGGKLQGMEKSRNRRTRRRRSTDFSYPASPALNDDIVLQLAFDEGK
jgi:hypothetical protein